MGLEVPQKYFQSSDVVGLAKSLLGMHLCTSFEGVLTAGVIVETEAYKAPEDKACHAYGNKRTARTEIMFDRGGVAYVYLCYGIHHLFNIVTGQKDEAQAVLIRAIEPVQGIEIMQKRRRFASGNKYNLTNGPGKLTQALGITTQYTGQELTNFGQGTCWLEYGERIPDENVVASKRIGVDYAKEWAEMPWRFTIKGNKWVSC